VAFRIIGPIEQSSEIHDRGIDAIGAQIFEGCADRNRIGFRAGRPDHRPLQSPPDYGVICRGEPFSTELTIAGEVRVILSVEPDCADTDFITKLIELRPNGHAILLMHGGEPRHLVPIEPSG
jgi:predicted acyl esterase